MKIVRSVIIIFLLLPITLQALEMESMRVLWGRNSTYPNIYAFGDSLLELYDQDFYIRTTDTLGNIGRVVSFSRDDIRTRPIYVPLGDNWFGVIVNRNRSGSFSWPYLYRFNMADTSFIEDRFTEIDLGTYCKVIDAKLIEGGDYMILYTDRDERTWFRTSRLTPEGEILWTVTVVPRQDNYHNFSQTTGFTQARGDPGRYYFYTTRLYLEGQNSFNETAVTLIDTSGEIIWRHVYFGNLFTQNIRSMVSFSDDTYGLIGMGRNIISYLHIDDDGDSLDSFTYFSGEFLGGRNLLTEVIDGEQLLICTDFDQEDGHLGNLGLLYINEGGDSLDGYYFHPDTASDRFSAKLLRPDGKVMLWVNDGLAFRGTNDILYTFYPEGRPEVGVSDDYAKQPSRFLLHPNYPNPFNSQTIVSFNLDKAGPVDVGVFDLNGRRVATLSEGSLLTGLHSFTWNALTASTGSYLVRIIGPSGTQSARLVLVR